jgi:2,4-didehydro-3-deoxy-L-rhamnonate hydrolase
MSDPTFELGTFASSKGRFAGLVMRNDVVDLSEGYKLFAASSPFLRGVLREPISVLGLLQDWDRNFAALQSIAAFVLAEDPGSDDLRPAMHQLDVLQILPPIIRPPKLLYAAANYRENVAGMRKTFRDNVAPIDPANDYQADKQKSEAYLFFKGNNCLCGAYDDIVLPAGVDRIDWEAELAVVIGRQGKNIPAAKAMGHVAGYMTTNDISCRSRTWRADRLAHLVRGERGYQAGW